MASSSSPLTADSSIGTWIDHPVGGQIIRELLAQGGQTPDVMRPVRRLALRRLVKLSKGQFTDEMVADMVRRAASGEVTAAADPTGAAVDTPSASAAEQAPQVEWVERITGGRFAGKTVIVTGAGSGIGKATASRVAREGGRVIAADISAERLSALSAELPNETIVTVVGDISADAGVAAIMAAAGDRVDALANVAGIMDNMTPVHEVSDEIWRRVFSINVDGAMKLMRATLPGMLAAGAGSVVNVASEAALRGSAAGVAYTASKHAVIGLTKSSAFMYGPSGIRVNAVAPGAVITNIEASFGSPLGADRVQTGMAVMPDPADAEALAASITFLLSDDGVNINGAVLASDGGWSAA